MIRKITLKNNIKIIDDKYVIKDKSDNILNVFNYLHSRSFDYFPQVLDVKDNKIYYEYLPDLVEPSESKMTDLIKLISLLHSKTTYYKEVDLDYYKYHYENLLNKIDESYNYYNNLMDNIEQEVYMSPPNYLISRNISLVYELLKYSKESLDKWYKIVENKKKIRYVLIHNNLNLDHYIKKDKPYLISWDKSKMDMPIYDLVILYKKHYLDYDFYELLNIYFKNYPLMKEELLLFIINISIPEKIIYHESVYENTCEIDLLIEYLIKTKNLIKEYRIKEETNERAEFDH